MVTSLVSLITINYNSLQDTLEFLKSVTRLSYKNIEVIVVDNASEKNPEETILEEFPFVKYIRSEQNLGFAGGNNLGTKSAKGDYLFFLNNDTLLFPEFLENIINFMQEHPDAGMASPKVLYEDGKTIQYAGAIGINFLGRGKRLGLLEIDNGQYDINCKTDLGHGAALIVPKKIIDEVGSMPEMYFLYYEEHDWCEQVKRHGYSMYYIGTSKIRHKESMSTGGNDSYIKAYYLNRNRFLYMSRNFQGIKFLLGTFYYFVVSIPKKIIFYIVKGRFQLAKAVLSGVIWNIRKIRVQG